MSDLRLMLISTSKERNMKEPLYTIIYGLSIYWLLVGRPQAELNHEDKIQFVRLMFSIYVNIIFISSLTLNLI